MIQDCKNSRDSVDPWHRPIGKNAERYITTLGEIQATFTPSPPAESARRGLVGQLLRFASIGVFSTIAYALLYLLFAGSIGPQAANFAALLITAIANTALNRRITSVSTVAATSADTNCKVSEFSCSVGESPVSR